MKRITIISILTIILMSSCIKLKTDSIIKVIDNIEREYFTVDGLRYELCLDNNSDGVSVVMLEEGKYQGEIIIPDEVKYKGDMLKVMVIGADAFKDCDKLERVAIGDNITVIGSNAFENSSISDIEIKKTIQVIGADAFRNCDKLTEIKIDSVQVVGADAFNDCDQLKKVEIESVQVVGADAFRGCDNLKDVQISNTQIVGENSFDECNKEMKVCLKNVMVIKKDAFNGCRNVETK